MNALGRIIFSSFTIIARCLLRPLRYKYIYHREQRTKNKKKERGKRLKEGKEAVRSPETNLAHGIDAHRHNLGPRPVVHELIHELPEQRLERVRRHQLVTRRRRRRQ